MTKQHLENSKKFHTFTVCAYKESPYIEDCIKSLINQTVKSNIIICSSTKNDYIEKIAKKYNIKTYFRKGKSDIQDDWNFAVSKTKTELVTVAHQDDIYDKNYTKYILKNYTGKESLLFSDNLYLINGTPKNSKNLKVKRILRSILLIPGLSRIKFIRKSTLAFGNTVQCPAATYNKKLIKNEIFTSDLKFGLDWDTFLKIYNLNYRIKYIPKKLMCFRISNESTTKQCMENSLREKEDIIMFKKFWPNWIVNIIMKFYKKAYVIYDDKEGE